MDKLVTHKLLLLGLLYKSVWNAGHMQLLKFTIILPFYDAEFEGKLVMLLVFMFKELSHNLYTLFYILGITLNPGYYTDFLIAFGQAHEKFGLTNGSQK